MEGANPPSGKTMTKYKNRLLHRQKVKPFVPPPDWITVDLTSTNCEIYAGVQWRRNNTDLPPTQVRNYCQAIGCMSSNVRAFMRKWNINRNFKGVIYMVGHPPKWAVAVFNSMFGLQQKVLEFPLKKFPYYTRCYLPKAVSLPLAA